jgi:hypothetical protein
MHAGQTGHHGSPIAKRIQSVLMSEFRSKGENNENDTETPLYILRKPE